MHAVEHRGVVHVAGTPAPAWRGAPTAAIGRWATARRRERRTANRARRRQRRGRRRVVRVSVACGEPQDLRVVDLEQAACSKARRSPKPTRSRPVLCRPVVIIVDDYVDRSS